MRISSKAWKTRKNRNILEKGMIKKGENRIILVS